MYLNKIAEWSEQDLDDLIDSLDSEMVLGDDGVLDELIRDLETRALGKEVTNGHDEEN